MWLKGVENLLCEERLGELGSSKLEKQWIFGFGEKSPVSVYQEAITTTTKPGCTLWGRV